MIYHSSTIEGWLLDLFFYDIVIFTLPPGVQSDSSLYEHLQNHPPPKPRRISGSAPRDMPSHTDDDVDFVPSSVRNRIAAFESGEVRPQVEDDVIIASVDERRGVLRGADEPNEADVVAKQQLYLELADQLNALDDKHTHDMPVEGSHLCACPRSVLPYRNATLTPHLQKHLLLVVLHLSP